MKRFFSTRVYQFIILHSSFIIFLSSCSVQKQIARSANEDVLSNKALTAAHVGISIFDPAANKYLYNHQGDKYFVPASNTKIPTCYAAMKYLGDSLVGLRYEMAIYSDEGPDTLIRFEPTGDPTFLHPYFKKQPVFDFLRNNSYRLNFVMPLYYDRHFGNGWSWNDFQESYMAPRSFFPIYGNIVRFKVANGTEISVEPVFFAKNYLTIEKSNDKTVKVTRNNNDNRFVFQKQNPENIVEARRYSNLIFEIPFLPQKGLIESLLSDTLQKREISYAYGPGIGYTLLPTRIKYPKIIHSQPTDSLLKPMMHRSDNFFAEQSLLMVSNEMLGVMNDEKIIDTLLKTDFKDLPQKPRWADGSGISRYNLFTPQDLVAILSKMKYEFGMERIRVIFPTGGEGTISNYYKTDSGYIYGKTGTLSGVVAFSGYLYTKKGKLLIFSTLVNNHQSNATDVRRAIEKFLQGVQNNY
ncbi:MAG: D-alanyl-D-alanine carboxypeptidase/D-alanyl-D-alanine-endopeptidase [Bacteroidota bacterium]